MNLDIKSLKKAGGHEDSSHFVVHPLYQEITDIQDISRN